MNKKLREYFQKIGMQGGKATSPAKTKANKLNALKRWNKNQTSRPKDEERK